MRLPTGHIAAAVGLTLVVLTTGCAKRPALTEPAAPAPTGATAGVRAAAAPPATGPILHVGDRAVVVADPAMSRTYDLVRKLADSPRNSRILEERIVELQTNLAGVTAQNERLAATLREARDQIVALKEEVDRLAQPPAGFGVFLVANEDGTADIFTGGRKLRVNVSPSVELEELRRGQEVMLNEALNVVEAMELMKARLGKVKTNAEFLMTMNMG